MSTGPFPYGDTRNACTVGYVLEIAESSIASGPKTRGVCTSGGKAYELTLKDSFLDDAECCPTPDGEGQELQIEEFERNTDLPPNVKAEPIAGGLIVMALDDGGNAVSLTFVPEQSTGCGCKKSRSRSFTDCEQNCYDARNRCFDLGGSAERCDRLYDECVDRCP